MECWSKGVLIEKLSIALQGAKLKVQGSKLKVES
jgi:hypothetical protein